MNALDPKLIWSAEDATRVTFLRALDDAADIEVSDWEAAFIESIFKQERFKAELLLSLTPRQRGAVDQMIKSYLHRLPLKSAVQSPESRVGSFKLPAAPKGFCNYIVPGEGGQLERCGQPLTANPDFCAEHERAREEYRARLRELKNQHRRK